jgi:hypothetical protein
MKKYSAVFTTELKPGQVVRIKPNDYCNIPGNALVVDPDMGSGLNSDLCSVVYVIDRGEYPLRYKTEVRIVKLVDVITTL